MEDAHQLSPALPGRHAFPAFACNGVVSERILDERRKFPLRFYRLQQHLGCLFSPPCSAFRSFRAADRASDFVPERVAQRIKPGPQPLTLSEYLLELGRNHDHARGIIRFDSKFGSTTRNNSGGSLKLLVHEDKVLTALLRK